MNVQRLITLCVTLVCCVTPIFSQDQAPQLTVDAIYRDFSATESLPDRLTWLPNSDRYSYVSDRGNGAATLYVVEAKTGARESVVSLGGIERLNGDAALPSLRTYQWLPNETGLILTGSGEVWHYSLGEARLTRLTRTSGETELVRISPDSRYISYVRSNNLYVQNLLSGKTTQLTFDGNDLLLNGKLDYVYQEELGERGDFLGYKWSPDSRHISYYQFDDSPVPEYPIVDWIPTHPEFEMMRYPKAGDSNPLVKIGVVSVSENPETIWMNIGDEPDIYLPRMYWVPNGNQLAIMRLDRAQHHLDFLFADITSGESNIIITEEDPYWINIEDHVYFFENSGQFLWGSDRSGFRHLYLYNNSGELMNQVTEGEWIVENLEHVDESSGIIYFTATEKDVTERHLYKVNLDGSQLRRLTEESGTHTADFSTSGLYYIHSYDSVLRPEQMFLENSQGDQIRVIAENPQPFLEQYNLSDQEFFVFQGSNDTTYNGWLFRPPNFDSDEQYPVIVYVYGGPHSQVVDRSFGGTTSLWHQMMAQKGYLVFSMDNRGSAGRGHQWEQAIDLNFGAVEFRDQMIGVNHLKSLSYVDTTRIGIWGWSYGGYMTLYSMTHSDVFSAGVSVAPVTDWRNYDTIYTERYMGLPEDNPDGYERSSVVNTADDLSGKLLLVHGTGDVNVHMQNSIQMVDELIDAGINFDFMVYPQGQHSISTQRDRIHLFQKITDHFDRYLMGEMPADE